MNAFTHPTRRTNLKKTMLMTLAAMAAATAMLWPATGVASENSNCVASTEPMGAKSAVYLALPAKKKVKFCRVLPEI